MRSACVCAVCAVCVCAYLLGIFFCAGVCLCVHASMFASDVSAYMSAFAFIWCSVVKCVSVGMCALSN